MNRPKVLITRKIPDQGLEMISERCSVELFDQPFPIPRNVLMEKVIGKDGILCLLSDRIDGEVMDAAGPQLRVISNYAVGVDNIDVKEATRRGILVTNTPGVLREATADLSWALLMSAARRIPESDRYMRQHRFAGWGPELMLGYDVYGKTIGIIGMGDIGTAVAERAKGFSMRILYHNRSRKPNVEKELGAEYVPLDTLLRESDFVCLHVPLTDQTRHLIGERELGMMKRTAILVNVARGEVVDEAALVRVLRDRGIAYAGLDVYEHEPKMTPGLERLDNVVLTPHTGSATYTTRSRMAIMAAKGLIDGLMGRRPENLVNANAWKG